MAIQRNSPPIVKQHLKDSCWAAVLQAWSRADARISWVDEMDLVGKYGEGLTGGITPETKLPVLAERFKMRADGYPGDKLWPYLYDFLPKSHVFCAYRRGKDAHAVLIWKISDDDFIHYMDPDGGFMRKQKERFFIERGPLAIMSLL